MEKPIRMCGAKLFTMMVLFAALLILAGCGGMYGGGTTAPPATSGATTMVVNMSDAPADRVIAFEITVTSINLFRTDNTMYSALSSPRHVELTHLAGSTEPVALPALPQGTYKSATVDLSSPEVIYIDNSGAQVKKELPNATFSLSIPFNPNLVVGTSPVVLKFDVDVSSSVTIDPATGNVTVNPVIHVTQAMVPDVSHEDQEDLDDGQFEHIVGQVTAASAQSFTINLAGSGTSLTFVTDPSTKIEGASSTAALPLNSTVRVEGTTQPDGTVRAKEVEVVSMSGSELEGLVVATTGSPVSSFDVVVQDGNGAGMGTAALGTTKTVTIGTNTRFRADTGDIDLGGLSLPDFSAASLSKGQRVEAESDNSRIGTNLAADAVKLQSQALVGAISGASSTQFTLTVADDSAFKLLTGKSTLTVFTQRNTKLNNGATITNAAIVKIRGLVFFDSVSGNFRMVAGRITTP